MTVPLSQLAAIDADESTQEAIGITGLHRVVFSGAQTNHWPTNTPSTLWQGANNHQSLHARFGLGGDALKPYREAVDRWLWPDVLRNQDTSVVKANQAISSYKKAVGEPVGLVELIVFYCERAAGFCSDVGYQGQPVTQHPPTKPYERDSRMRLPPWMDSV